MAAVLNSCGSDTTSPTSSNYPAALEIIAGDGQSAVVGTELPTALVVRVVDSSKSPVKGQLVNFRVVTGGGSVFAGSSVTNDSGIARERWTLGTSTADSQRVEARAVDNNTGATIVFATFLATALPGPPTQILKVAGDSQTALPNAPVGDSLVVRVADRYGNGVDGLVVSWTADVGSGTISPSAYSTRSQGLAKTHWVLGAAAGTQTLTATTVTVPPAHFLAFASPAQSAVLVNMTFITNTLYDSTLSFLKTVHFTPPIIAVINGKTDTLKDESFITSLWQRPGNTLCEQVFGGSGFPSVQQLFVTVTPVKLSKGISGDIGYNQDAPDTLFIRSGPTGFPTSIDTITYVATWGSYTSSSIDPFTEPLPAPWGRDPSHLTKWQLNLTDATAKAPTVIPFQVDSTSCGG